MTIAKYVEALSDESRKEIIRNYEEFARLGYIGDCEMRHHAERLMEEVHIEIKSYITWWMRELTFECYRHYAYLYLRAES